MLGKNIFIKIYILISLLCYNKDIYNIINIFIKSIKIDFEIYKIKSFLKFCSKQNNNVKKFKKRNNPTISIISPIYNREKRLKRFLKSLQYQNFKDFEIILVDDFSKDNSVNVIKEFQQEDKRIILIKNRKNKGTFVTRNIGILFSKGKYINIPDPDDIFFKDILNNCYMIAKKYNYDIIRFNIFLKNKIWDLEIIDNIEKRPIYQPKLSTYIFYGCKKLRITDIIIVNKFVKKEVLIRAINCLNKYYLIIYMTFFEDGLLNYFIHLEGKSLFFLKKIGYIYIKNTESITKNTFKLNTLKFKLLFFYLKLVFDYSKNTQYCKDVVNSIFNYFIKNNFNILNILPNSNNNEINYFYKGVINKFLHYKFISNENKIFLQNLKLIFKKKNEILLIKILI